MSSIPLKRRVVLILLAGVIVASSCTRPGRRELDLPGLMLWAWQRPEDLSFIDTRTTGVAYLAGTIRIATSGYETLEPRLQPLSLPRGAAVLAVIRIESAPVHGAVNSAVLVHYLKEMAKAPGNRGLQIDFDARNSERALYRTLLSSLNSGLNMPVSVTALASWCAGDPWLDHEAIAEAVPMFFRMGEGENREMRIASEACRSSIGLSTDEPWPLRRPAGLKRIYLFNSRAWNRETYARAVRKVENWQ